MNSSVARQRRSVIPIAVAAVAVLGVAVAGYFFFAGPSAPAVALTFDTVGRRDIDVVIKVSGELQAVNNIDVLSDVEGSATIQYVVPEGSMVKKGDVIVELEASSIRQRIDDTTLDVQKAEADLINTREMLAIQRSQNAANLESATVSLELAKLALRKFTEGDFPQNLSSAETALRMARINLQNREDDFRQVQELAARGFLTPTDVKLRELEVTRARNDLSDAENKLKNLRTFDYEKTMAEMRSAVAQAEQRLVRVERENAANIAQREADLGARGQALDLQRRKLDKLKQQLVACTIRAPEDGLVVYASTVDRNQQQSVQQGSQVRERQMILRLPDTSRMKAAVRVQEAMIARTRPGMRATVSISGLPPLLGTVTKISIMADNSNRWWAPDVREFPVDIELDETPAGLKPGMRADTEIFSSRLHDVLAVPVSAIYSSGPSTYVFLDAGKEANPVPRQITLGLANDTHVQVMEGLTGGEQVLILQAAQGRKLLAAAGIAETPATRPSVEAMGGPDGPPNPGGMPGQRPGGAGNGGAGSGGTGPGATPGERPQRRREGGGAAPQSRAPTTQATPKATAE
jgi:HlyD family secretion protein